MDKGYSSSNNFKSNNSVGNNGVKNTNTNNTELKPNEISKNRLEHSNEGDYVQDGKRHAKGGHGQDSIDFMDANGMKYEINIEYNNGVRVGNIPNSKQRTARSGNNHSWFPKNWNESKIRSAANHVASGVQNPIDGKQYSSMYDNVKVTIIFNGGKIETVFPNKNQPGGKKK